MKQKKGKKRSSGTESVYSKIKIIRDTALFLFDYLVNTKKKDIKKINKWDLKDMQKKVLTTIKGDRK